METCAFNPLSSARIALACRSSAATRPSGVVPAAAGAESTTDASAAAAPTIASAHFTIGLFRESFLMRPTLLRPRNGAVAEE
jgi:hypothetical protein